MNLVAIKSAIDALSAPTISFTILTVIFPFIFPPSDWFEKIHRKTGLWRMWTKPGGVIGMILITAFFVIGYFDDPNYVIIIYRIPITMGSISYMGCNGRVKHG